MQEQSGERSRLSKRISKLLFLCWAIVVLHIWLASEGEDFLEHHHLHHPSDDPDYNLRHEGFGVPDREYRLMDVVPDGFGERREEFVALNNGVVGDSSLALVDGRLSGHEIGGHVLQPLDVPTETSNNVNIPTGDFGLLQGSFPGLPGALQPITNESCCLIAAHQNDPVPKDLKCFGTCYTDRACNDLAYPFTSAEEKARFPLLGKLTESLRSELGNGCFAPKLMVPPMEWCQQPHYTIGDSQSASHLVGNIPPAGCSNRFHGPGSGAFQNVIIFPSAKLAFCGIPKVGITQWVQFSRFVAGAKDYLSLPHFKLDIDHFRFDKLDPATQKQIWDDESWTFAAFLRDPAERLLSAYLDKIVGNKRMSALTGKNFTFDKFVEHLSTPFSNSTCFKGEESFWNHTGLNWCSDPHWRPQVFSCGLSERLDRFKFVGDIQNMAKQTRELLTHVGLWESHGKHFINDGIRPSACKVKPMTFHEGSGGKPSHVGFQQNDESSNETAANTVYGHSKQAKNKMDEYYTPELLNVVREKLYAEDYNLWKLVNDKNSMTSGKELAARMSNKCAKSLGIDFETLVRENEKMPLKPAETNQMTKENIISDKMDTKLNRSSYVTVEALQPISSDSCCFIAARKDKDDNRPNPKCLGTCFTERACTDDVYPFASADEKKRYPTAEKTQVGQFKQLLNECLSPKLMYPPMEWCQKSHVIDTSDRTKPASIIRDVPPAGCSHKVHGGGSGAFQNLLIFPSAKLAFCGIPKVGITQWIQFLRFVAGAKDYLSDPHYKHDVDFFRFDKLEPNVQKEIWEDDSWTFATFLRDPAERLLSAYLDKFKKNKARTTKNGIFTYERFVELLASPFNGTKCETKSDAGDNAGLTWCTDPHWRPQAFSCGMSERLDRFQFVGDIQKIADQTRDLLSHVGLWESHGMHFVNEGEVPYEHSCRIKPQSIEEGSGGKPKHVGFQQIYELRNKTAANTVYGHSKQAKDKLDEYYTPELLDVVRKKLYPDDYRLWKLVNEKRAMSSGKELAAQMSSECALE